MSLEHCEWVYSEKPDSALTYYRGARWLVFRMDNGDFTECFVLDDYEYRLREEDLDERFSREHFKDAELAFPAEYFK